MNLRSTLLTRAVPGFVKMRLLDELARATAVGFGQRAASVEKRLPGHAPRGVRSLHSRQAERVLEAGDQNGVEAVKHDLRRQSTELGAKVRRRLRLRRPAEVAETLTALYGYLGIDASADAAGEIVVRGCMFAGCFSEPVCELVGALDEGLAAGLSGGGRLEFIERITGGAACCRARFDMGGTAR